MKQIITIVRPFLAEKLLENLRFAPLESLSVLEVKGFGRQKNYLNKYADTEYSQTFLPKVEVSMMVDDYRVEEVLQRISEVARLGRMGDGKTFVLPVADVIDIATADKRNSSSS
jgi:nitrogen regulatory protein P-II 1